VATQVRLRRALSAPAALVWRALTTADARLTWQWDGEASESVVAIHLTDTGAGTDLVVPHEGLADEDAREHHAKGWSDCLDRLPGWLDSADRSSS